MLILGDCLEKLKELEDNSVDSIVTDPPYGISFMGKKWDYDVPKVEVWQECLRVLKPGGHALVACGTRTQHRMAVNLEDGGFEIRDLIFWHFGSGFPKSHNIEKSLKKMGEVSKAEEYKGFGTALKPSTEIWTLCRKPLEEKTIASNVLKWGCGGINIDGCRVGTEGGETHKGGFAGSGIYGDSDGVETDKTATGRFPANLIHDGSDEVVEGFPETKSGSSGKGSSTKVGGMFGNGNKVTSPFMPASEGSASRFFYCAKASKSERNKGCEEIFVLKEKIPEDDLNEIKHLLSI